MALTQEQVTLISVAAFGVAPGEVHSNYFLDSDAAGKFFVGGTDKQIHEVLGLKEPLTGTAAVAAVLEHEYNYLVSVNGLEKVSNAEFVKNVAKNLGAEDSKTLAVDLASGMSRYDALAKFAQAEADKAGGIENVAGIITAQKSDKTIDNAAKDLIASAVKPDTPTKPEIDGETYVLTDGRDGSGRDNITGTDDNDTFLANVGQNQNAAIGNALSTGDRLDGGKGWDTLEATLINDNEVDGFGNEQAPRPMTKSIEEVRIEALEDVTLDATRMEDVQQHWSEFSRDSLKINNVNLRGDDGKLEVTKDVTFGVKDVDANSGFAAAFESQALKNQGTNTQNSRIEIQVGDANKAADNTTPIDAVKLDLSFTFGGEKYLFENINSVDGTYAGLVTAIRAALDAEGLTDLVVEAGNPLRSITAQTTQVETPLAYNSGVEIIIRDPAGGDFAGFESAAGAILGQASSAVVSDIKAVEANKSTTLIESNLILDNAGRASTAGDVVIGGFSNSGTVVEKLNLQVDDSSKINTLATATNMANGSFTNGVYSTGTPSDVTGFREIELTSLAGKGAVSIGSIMDTTTFNANAFEGSSLTIGEATALQTLNANIEGSVDVTATAFDGKYTTGSGADTLVVEVMGGSFDLKTNGGNDTVTVTATDTISYATMEKLDSLKIDTGAGNDTVNVNTYKTFDIKTGAGDDFVRINSVDANGNGNATTGAWKIGDASQSTTNYFDEKVLYKAKLTVSFAGFEETVAIETKNGFVATQADINAAIFKAIKGNPELKQLLDVTPSDTQLNITSTIGGENNLGIAIYQPELVTSSTDAKIATGEAVQLTTNDEAALRQGLIKTGAAIDSDAADTDAKIITLVGHGSVAKDGTVDSTNYTTAQLEGDVVASAGNSVETGILGASDYFGFGDATAGSLSGTNDASGAINLSSINLGSGANDLVVMHSGDLASNKIVIDQSFGKISVVNWHTTASEGVLGGGATGQMGKHALDFSHYLNNEQDLSTNLAGNNDSAKLVNSVVNLTTGHGLGSVTPGVTTSSSALANTANVIRFQQDISGNKTETFANLTKDKLIAALNDANDDGTSNYGNLSQGLLTPGANANLVGNVQKHIVMVENALNEGEYKVFYLTSTLDQDNKATDTAKQSATTNTNQFDTSTAVELGTLDFGASINFNLVGNQGYTNYVKALTDAKDISVVTGQPLQDFTYIDTDGNKVTVSASGETVVDPGTGEPGTDVPAVEGEVVVTGTEGSVSFAGTDAEDTFVVKLPANTGDLALANVVITDFSAGDSVNLTEAGVFASIAGSTQPFDVSVNAAGTGLDVILVDSSTFVAWTVSVETADQAVLDAVTGAADTDAAITGIEATWGADWLVF